MHRYGPARTIPFDCRQWCQPTELPKRFCRFRTFLHEGFLTNYDSCILVDFCCRSPTFELPHSRYNRYLFALFRARRRILKVARAEVTYGSSDSKSVFQSNIQFLIRCVSSRLRKRSFFQRGTEREFNWRIYKCLSWGGSYLTRHFCWAGLLRLNKFNGRITNV